MGTVFREHYTKPVPVNAVVRREGNLAYAEWTDKRGRSRKERITLTSNGPKLYLQSKVYVAKYRDGDGIVRKESTGCRSLPNARQRLAELEDRAERIRSGIWTSEEVNAADFQAWSIESHLSDYLDALRQKRIRGRAVSAHHLRNVEPNLRRAIEFCGAHRLADLNEQQVQRWINARIADGVSPATINRTLSALKAFFNWCVEEGRISRSPLLRVRKLGEQLDQRRRRRALKPDELDALFTAARLRPLAELARPSEKLPEKERIGRRSWFKPLITAERLIPCADAARAERGAAHPAVVNAVALGHQRELIYRVLAATGLRKSELASLTLADVYLTGKAPHLLLSAAASKAAKPARIPIPDDLKATLQDWVRSRSRSASASRQQTKLFDVSRDLIRVFDRDLVAAGLARAERVGRCWVIDKTDEDGRTLDVHALRHTFGTYLSVAGVSPRTAQAAMRHSDISLTMNIYTDPEHLAVAEAVNHAASRMSRRPKRKK